MRHPGIKEPVEDGNFAKGLLWAIVLSIPLWISIMGWIKIIKLVGIIQFIQAMIEGIA